MSGFQQQAAGPEMTRVGPRLSKGWLPGLYSTAELNQQGSKSTLGYNTLSYLTHTAKDVKGKQKTGCF